MIDTLKLFTTSTLFDATSALLDKLNIRFNRQTAEPISVADLYDGTMPQYLSNALGLIDHTYFIGVANDLSLESGKKDGESLDEISDIVENGGHYDGMFIFACDAFGDANITRSDISALTRAFNRISYANPVILVIRQGHHISLSTCERMTYTQEWRRNFGEKLGKVSILRDVDYLKPHRGHVDIINDLVCSDCNTFDKLYAKWNKLFNSEVLTKKFYNELFEWYQWAVDPATNVTFPGDADTPDDDREDIDTRVIRLITRLMFVWFIKQKKLVPRQIFDKDYVSSILKDFDPYSKTQSNYYQGILQNLFFATLNRPIVEDGEKRGFATKGGKEVTNLYRYGSTDEDGGLFAISDQEVVDLFSTVPFLNCGLFECLDKNRRFDGVERRYYNDGFSRNIQKFKNGTYRYRAVVPNILFFHEEKGILSIFKRNIFTIEENTPQDVQVALDPELLGKVFENLLGAYNPETKETARNQSGSFYTPREIVQYMVNESLVAHLKRTVDDSLESEYRKLLSFNDEEVLLSDEQKTKIVHSIFTCKVLDPACGSGAFPMGMLQQMVHVLQRVDPDNLQWRKMLENLAADDSRNAFGIKNEEARNAKLDEIRETFNNALNSPDYTRKLYIIESCIYGSDIQPIAMLITRLRFFITLVCEQNDIRRDKPEDNFGIKTLPNLESKFVAANSLMDADIHKFGQELKYDKQLIQTKDELLSIRHKHFYTHKRGEKIDLRKQDESIREKLQTLITTDVAKPDDNRIRELEQIIADCERELPQYEMALMTEEAIQTDIFGNADKILVDKNKDKRNSLKTTIRKCKSEIEKERNKKTPPGFEKAVLQVTDWNPYDQNKVAPFLDLEWMFGMTEGFDIVIGNPPYIQLQADKGKLAKQYESCGYETFDKTGDIYCLFYERGNTLLKKDGLLCYITSNKWMRAGYGKNLRNYLTSKTNPSLLIDFGETHVFESATVMTNILMFANVSNQYQLNSTQIREDFTNPATVGEYVAQNNIYCSFKDDESWVIMPDDMRDLKNRVESKGKPLEEWNVSIYRGILTGFDKAFWVSTKKRNEILDTCETETEKNNTAKLIRPLLRGKDIRKYATNWDKAQIWLINTHNGVKKTINKKKVTVLERINIEDYPAVKTHLDDYFTKLSARSDKGDTIYNLRNCAYVRDFDKPKIIYPETSKFLPFYYDENGFLANKTCFIMVGEKYLGYLTAFLNSSLFKFCFRESFPVLFGGARGMSKAFFDKIPVMEVDDATDAEFHTLVMDIQKEYSDEKAKYIDQKIFDLYGLSQEERDLIGYIDYHKSGSEEDEEEE